MGKAGGIILDFHLFLWDDQNMTEEQNHSIDHLDIMEALEALWHFE